MFHIVILHQPSVDRVHVIDQRHVHIRVQLRHLIEVERREQPVPPAKRRVRINQNVLGLFCRRQDIFDHASPQTVQPGQWQIQYSPRHYIGCFGVHHLTHVEQA